MTTIETIRAEIDKRYAEYRAKMKTDDFTYYEGMADALDLFEQFLDTLQEQPVEWKDEYREEDLRTRFAFYTYKNEEDDSVLYLSNVFVEEASRNAGFGTKILEAAEKVAETIGAITIRLKVKQDSPANAWYRKRGYGYIAFEGDYDWLEKNLEYLKPKRNKQPVEGLEEEIQDWCKENVTGVKPIYTGDSLICGLLPKTARHFAEWGMNQMPLPEDTTIFQKGIAEGKRLMMEKAVAVEVVGDKRDLRLINSTERCLFNAKRGDWLKVIVIPEEKKI